MARSQESANLQKLIISVVIIGVVLVLGIYITDSLQDVTKDTNTPGTILNESVTFVATNTPQTLDVSGLEDVVCTTTPIQVLNNTKAGASLGVTNVTLTSSCTLLNATALASFIGNGTVYVSYSYTYTATTEASNSAGDVVTALSTGTSWISILVVVGFAVVILTMLTSGLGGAARREEVPYY